MKQWIFAACVAMSLAEIALATPASVLKPSTIRFEEPLADAEERLGELCDTVTVRQIEPVQIPSVSQQTQIDCQGFELSGGDRLAEFVYGDGQLYMVWVLVQEDELEGLASSMTQAYGKPTHSSEAFNAYTNHRTALRRDIPEILFYAPVASAQFEGWFSQQSQ